MDNGHWAMIGAVAGTATSLLWHWFLTRKRTGGKL